jgi:hypothetical protein
MSRRLPAVKPKEVLRALAGAGFFIHHTSQAAEKLGFGVILSEAKNLSVHWT